MGQTRLDADKRFIHHETRIDVQYMAQALDLARLTPKTPFGCVIVYDHPNAIRDIRVVAESYGTGGPTDCTAHSEILAIREAQSRWREGDLTDCTIYSTHEPCTMCAGAIVHAKPSRVVFGSLRQDLPLHFRRRIIAAKDILMDCSQPPTVVESVMRNECVALFDSVPPRFGR